MEFKGTKGVWYPVTEENRDPVIMVHGYDMETVCSLELDGSTTPDRMIANSKLIAAAPELLFQVSELIELLAFHGHTNSTEIYQAKQLLKKITE